MQREPITMDFSSFLQHFAWRQGEHVCVIGPTGCGKTTLLNAILPQRRYVVFFATKLKDTSIDRLRNNGFAVVREWPPRKPLEFWKDDPDKIVLWPKASGGLSRIRSDQRSVFSKALNSIFAQGAWTVVFDECHYMSTELKLDDEIAMYHHQGRSNNITIVDGAQRPAFLPVVVYSSASHAFIWNTTEERDFKRLSDMGGINAKDLEKIIRNLNGHQFVYVNTRGNLPPIISETERM